MCISYWGSKVGLESQALLSKTPPGLNPKIKDTSHSITPMNLPLKQVHHISSLVCHDLGLNVSGLKDQFFYKNGPVSECFQSLWPEIYRKGNCSPERIEFPRVAKVIITWLFQIVQPLHPSSWQPSCRAHLHQRLLWTSPEPRGIGRRPQLPEKQGINRSIRSRSTSTLLPCQIKPQTNWWLSLSLGWWVVQRLWLQSWMLQVLNIIQ